MTYKQLETSREVRLWITQVIVPAMGIATALVATVPEVRETVVTKARIVKDKIKCKIRK